MQALEACVNEAHATLQDRNPGQADKEAGATTSKPKPNPKTTSPEWLR
jgi:hypothetical protein